MRSLEALAAVQISQIKAHQFISETANYLKLVSRNIG